MDEIKSHNKIPWKIFSTHPFTGYIISGEIDGGTEKSVHLLIDLGYPPLEYVNIQVPQTTCRSFPLGKLLRLLRTTTLVV